MKNEVFKNKHLLFQSGFAIISYHTLKKLVLGVGGSFFTKTRPLMNPETKFCVVAVVFVENLAPKWRFPLTAATNVNLQVYPKEKLGVMRDPQERDRITCNLEQPDPTCEVVALHGFPLKRPTKWVPSKKTHEGEC